MAINPYGSPQGYYPPTSYQQPNPYAAPGYGPQGSYGPDMYGGYQAMPPGGGMAGGINSIGSSLGGIFGVLGSILNSVFSLVSNVVNGVLNLVTSVLGAILRPIMSLFGGGGGGNQQAQQRPQQGQAATQVPIVNQTVETALQAAEAAIQQYEQYARQAQTNRQASMVNEYVQMMNRAMADFQRHHEEIARVGRPDQVQAFDARAQEVLEAYQTLIGNDAPVPAAASAATPGDLSGLQLPNDPQLQQNLAQFNQNYQLLAQAPGRAAQLTAEERTVVTQSIGELRRQATAFQSSNPQVATTLTEAVNRLDQAWQQAIAGSPAAAQSAQGAPAPGAAAGGTVATGSARQYRQVPLDLEGPAPAPAVGAGSVRGN